MSQIGTSDNPLRIAIIGSGPSGFYAADRLEKEAGLVVEIDMFDRLPTPFGLVRGGVAPDHAKIKNVTKAYDKIAADLRFHFYGNVTFGRDLTLADIQTHYHAVIYAVGAQSDRKMGIPGEELPGSHAATEFVGWYNGHPDYRDLQFDLSQERVAVIGNGNVAMDVARILAKTPQELAETDIADHALEALRHSHVREIYILGRRGPVQAAFTNPEIKELGELDDADILVDADDMLLDAASAAALAAADRDTQNNVAVLNDYVQRTPSGTGKTRRLHVRFCVSPVALHGEGCVEAMTLVRNALIANEDGSIRAQATDETETIPVGLVFRSIGYKGVALAGVPFDEKRGVIPNAAGRVVDAEGAPLAGQYVVGWIKRGPSGVIGTNKPDSVETVERLLEDLRAGALNVAQAGIAITDLLKARGVEYVTYSDWQTIDALEQARGAEHGKTRVKFTSVAEMLAALRGGR
jgi:ferredoxin/flavodoxin---NADP+ reductase